MDASRRPHGLQTNLFPEQELLVVELRKLLLLPKNDRLAGRCNSDDQSPPIGLGEQSGRKRHSTAAFRRRDFALSASNSGDVQFRPSRGCWDAPTAQGKPRAPPAIGAADAHQVISGAARHHLPGELGVADTPALAQAADGVQPAEDLLDAFAKPLEPGSSRDAWCGRRGRSRSRSRARAGEPFFSGAGGRERPCRNPCRPPGDGRWGALRVSSFAAAVALNPAAASVTSKSAPARRGYP